MDLEGFRINLLYFFDGCVGSLSFSISSVIYFYWKFTDDVGSEFIGQNDIMHKGYLYILRKFITFGYKMPDFSV